MHKLPLALLSGASLLTLAAWTADAKTPARWTSPCGSLSCPIPQNWAILSQEGKASDSRLILQAKRAQGASRDAFLNVAVTARKSLSAKAPKDFEEYVTWRLKELTVTPADRTEATFHACEAVRCSGSVKATGDQLFDLLLFAQGKDHVYEVMLTCLPKDRKHYEPDFETVLKNIELHEGKP